MCIWQHFYIFWISTHITILLATSILLFTYVFIPHTIYGLYYILLWTEWTPPTEDMTSTMTRNGSYHLRRTHLRPLLFLREGSAYILVLYSKLTLSLCRTQDQPLVFYYPILCPSPAILFLFQNFLVSDPLYFNNLFCLCLIAVLLSIYLLKFGFLLICLPIYQCPLCTTQVQTIYDFCWSTREIEPSPLKK